MKYEYGKLHYDKSRGLSYDGHPLTDFNLHIIGKKIIRDTFQNKNQKYYRVEVNYTDGRSDHSEWISDLKNLDLFDCFEINECSISNDAKKLLSFKLMYEAKQVPWEIFVDSHLGLQVIGDCPVYVFGEHVLWENGKCNTLTVTTHHTLSLNKYMDKKELLKQCSSYISLLPRTTEILFYGSLFAIVKPFLAQLKIPGGSLLALVAPAGHLKTTLVRMYALWLNIRDEQEIGFYTHQRDKDILNIIEKLQGQNFLLDDMHKIMDSNESRRQERRLDIVSRHVNMNRDCANVIITGETMEEMGIFSCMDRIFQLRMPKMNAGQIESLKKKISMLEQELMPSVALAFAKALMENYEAVLEDIRMFYFKNVYDTEAAEGYATRIYKHGMFIRMTKYLFDKYLCDPELYLLNDGNALELAIKEQVQIQQTELQKIRFREEKHDYIAELYRIIQNNGKYIRVCTPNQYDDFDHSCVLYNDRVYITSTAIKNAFFNCYQRYVAPKLIVDALHQEGILEEESGSNGRQKNYQGKKHYVLNRKIFATYMYRNGYKLTKADHVAYFPEMKEKV